MEMLLSIDPGIRGVGAAMFGDGKLLVATYVRNPAREGGGPRECAVLAHAVVAWAEEHRFRFSGDIGLFPRVSKLVLEHPQTYGGRASKGDSNSLFPLAGVDAALAALFFDAETSFYVPHDWKQGVEKPEDTKHDYIIEKRVRVRLSEVELTKIEWPRNVRHTWDVTDAIGIGLKALNRFERHRVYARE